MTPKLTCHYCKTELLPSQRSLICPACSALGVEFTYDRPPSGVKFSPGQKGIWHFQDLLPRFTQTITMDEGNTPLRRVTHLYEDDLDLWLKLEGTNPTGSFFDRVSALMVSDASAQGKTHLLCASDGNFGASISAYCTRSQIKCKCIVPKSTSPEKKTQIRVFGAELVEFGDTIDQSVAHARKMVEEGWYQGTPQFNVLTVEGQKTIAFEICESLGASTTPLPESPLQVPNFEYILVPMGGGSLIYSIWKGFLQAQEQGLLSRDQLPKLIGVQVSGFDAIAQAIQAGENEPAKIDLPTSRKKDFALADAIMVETPFFGTKAIESIQESGGSCVSVTNKEIRLASKKLGEKEGVFAEFSSATVIAAIDKLLADGFFPPGTSLLALITGSGFKSSQAFFGEGKRTPIEVDPFKTIGTKFKILEILETESTFGYKLWKKLQKSLTIQAVYQHLKELTQKGLIEMVETESRQKPYTLTDKGKQLLRVMGEMQ